MFPVKMQFFLLIVIQKLFVKQTLKVNLIIYNIQSLDILSHILKITFWRKIKIRKQLFVKSYKLFPNLPLMITKVKYEM